MHSTERYELTEKNVKNRQIIHTAFIGRYGAPIFVKKCVFWLFFAFFGFNTRHMSTVKNAIFLTFGLETFVQKSSKLTKKWSNLANKV